MPEDPKCADCGKVTVSREGQKCSDCEGKSFAKELLKGLGKGKDQPKGGSGKGKKK